MQSQQLGGDSENGEPMTNDSTQVSEADKIVHFATYAREIVDHQEALTRGELVELIFALAGMVDQGAKITDFLDNIRQTKYLTECAQTVAELHLKVMRYDATGQKSEMVITKAPRQPAEYDEHFVIED